MRPLVQEHSLLFYRLGQARSVPHLPAELRSLGLPLWDALSKNDLDRLIQSRQWRALIVQVTASGPDSLARCAELREEYSGPLFALTAPFSDKAHVDLFALGLDDVIDWDRGPELIAARIRAHLRRLRPCPTADSTANVALKLKDLILDPARREVRRKNRPIHLTDKEFDLLHLLAQNLGRAVSREEISHCLRGQTHQHDDRSIDLRVSRLRRKLGDSGRHPDLIRTVRGLGYMLVPPLLGS